MRIQHCLDVISMSSEVQPRPDHSPNTSAGSSDAEQREAAPAAQQARAQGQGQGQGAEQRDQAQPKKKEAKISSKTAAKLSTSAKRIQKELAEITLDPPPNCSGHCSFKPWLLMEVIEEEEEEEEEEAEKVTRLISC
ncbi:hypothetical protein CRUP_002425 [Coryphaenoides rupestris]|nr:hypothetical protein CRUP_002425 [Coryphaenoides rupestris]